MLVVAGGMLKSSQCQKPTPVGASGSNSVMTKLLVVAGAPLHAKSGETLLPPQPLSASPLGMSVPLANALLVTVNSGTTPVPGARSVTVGVGPAVGEPDAAGVDFE